MVITLLPLKAKFFLQMTSRTLYAQVPSLPLMTKSEWKSANQQYESQVPSRKLLSLVCVDCSDLLPAEDFSDAQRLLRIDKRCPNERRFCISCGLKTTTYDSRDFKYGGIRSFACYGCQRALSLVSDLTTSYKGFQNILSHMVLRASLPLNETQERLLT